LHGGGPSGNLAAMNGRLVLALSLFGLVIGIGTVFAFPPEGGIFLSIAFLVACAVIIAKRAPGNYFLHSLAVCALGSIWLAGTQALLLDVYLAHHPMKAMLAAKGPLPPRLMMVVTAPVLSLIPGSILALLSLAASKLLRR
jgi:hypothetical protein